MEPEINVNLPCKITLLRDRVTVPQPYDRPATRVQCLPFAEEEGQRVDLLDCSCRHVRCSTGTCSGQLASLVIDGSKSDHPFGRGSHITSDFPRDQVGDVLVTGAHRVSFQG